MVSADSVPSGWGDELTHIPGEQHRAAGLKEEAEGGQRPPLAAHIKDGCLKVAPEQQQLKKRIWGKMFGYYRCFYQLDPVDIFT